MKIPRKPKKLSRKPKKKVNIIREGIKLPDDIISDKISPFLSLKDWLNFNCVCKHFNNCKYNNPLLWKYIDLVGISENKANEIINSLHEKKKNVTYILTKKKKLYNIIWIPNNLKKLLINSQILVLPS